MTIAWFLVPMSVKPHSLFQWMRYCPMDDFTDQLRAEGGDWAESEVLGNSAIVKVRASDALLGVIAGTAGFYRIPWDWLLADTMADWTNAQYNVVRARLGQMGFTSQEISAALGSNVQQWRTHTFEDLLRFVCSRRFKPLSIDGNGSVTFSDIRVLPLQPDELDRKVR